MNRVFALTACGLLISGAASAALEIDATVDRDRVPAGQQIELSVTVKGSSRSLPQPSLPDLDRDFDVYSRGSSRNFSFVNGRLSSSLSLLYILVPKREGSFTIGPISVEGEGERVQTQPIGINVIAATAPPVPPVATPGESGSSTGSEDIFVRATVDNATPYTEEQVTYRVRLFSRVDLLDNPGFTPPTTQGFWKEDLSPRDPYVETVDGVRYRVLEVALALFPTTPGELTIGESVLECSVKTLVRDRRSFFGGSFFDGKQVVLRSEPITLNVKPLPPDPSGTWNGAVGSFELQVTADKTQISQNDPLTLTARLSGRGNLHALSELELPELPDFRSYPSQGQLDSNIRNGKWGGTMRKQFVLVPLSAGEKTIPSIPVTIFDPKEGRYKTLRSQAVTIQAAAGAGLFPDGVTGARGSIELLGKDIRFIETEVPSFVTVGSRWAQVWVWLALLPLPLAAYGGFWMWDRRERRLGSNLALRRRMRAAKTARHALSHAARTEPTERPVRSAEAVRGYVADRYNLHAAGLTPEAVEKVLADDGIDPKSVLAFLERADAARYAPGADAEGVDWSAEGSVLIDTLEKRR